MLEIRGNNVVRTYTTEEELHRVHIQENERRVSMEIRKATRIHIDELDIHGLVLKATSRVLKGKVARRVTAIHVDGHNAQIRDEKESILAPYMHIIDKHREDLQQEAIAFLYAYYMRNQEKYTDKREMYYRMSYAGTMYLADYIKRYYLQAEQMFGLYEVGEDGQEYPIPVSNEEYFVNVFSQETYSFVELLVDVQSQIRTTAQQKALDAILSDVPRRHAAGVNTRAYNDVRQILKDALQQKN